MHKPWLLHLSHHRLSIGRRHHATYHLSRLHHLLTHHHLLWVHGHWNNLAQSIDICRIFDAGPECVDLHLPHALVFQEILDLIYVKTLLGEKLHELLLLVDEVRWDHAWIRGSWSH